MKFQGIDLIHNEPKHNFELWIDGMRSFIDYNIKDDTVLLLHTEVPKEQEGRGIAAALVEKTFVHLEQRNQKIAPICQYVKSFLQRHPEWEKLVAKTS